MKKGLIKFLIAFLIFGTIFAQNVFAASKMDKIQRNADIYFRITEILDLSLNQQRKAFGIKLDEMWHLKPLMEEISENEARLNNEKMTSKERAQLEKLLAGQKSTASLKKRYYVSKYREILTEEQNHKLDELIFDIANGYFKF